ncbi:MAG: hypothetical protein OXB84_07880 [Halobacteriovoraceae bacterium]|nr:hypothetical protein [Halobacteriovoraceae bacterium]
MKFLTSAIFLIGFSTELFGHENLLLPERVSDTAENIKRLINPPNTFTNSPLLQKASRFEWKELANDEGKIEEMLTFNVRYDYPFRCRVNPDSYLESSDIHTVVCDLVFLEGLISLEENENQISISRIENHLNTFPGLDELSNTRCAA